jgi:hypothetical protein
VMDDASQRRRLVAEMAIAVTMTAFAV